MDHTLAYFAPAFCEVGGGEGGEEKEMAHTFTDVQDSSKSSWTWLKLAIIVASLAAIIHAAFPIALLPCCSLFRAWLRYWSVRRGGCPRQLEFNHSSVMCEFWYAKIYRSHARWRQWHRNFVFFQTTLHLRLFLFLYGQMHVVVNSSTVWLEFEFVANEISTHEKMSFILELCSANSSTSIKSLTLLLPILLSLHAANRTLQ